MEKNRPCEAIVRPSNGVVKANLQVNPPGPSRAQESIIACLGLAGLLVVPCLGPATTPGRLRRPAAAALPLLLLLDQAKASQARQAQARPSQGKAQQASQPSQGRLCGRAAGGRANSTPTGVHPPPTQDCYPTLRGNRANRGGAPRALLGRAVVPTPPPLVSLPTPTQDCYPAMRGNSLNRAPREL